MSNFIKSKHTDELIKFVKSMSDSEHLGIFILKQYKNGYELIFIPIQDKNQKLFTNINNATEYSSKMFLEIPAYGSGLVNVCSSIIGDALKMQNVFSSVILGGLIGYQTRILTLMENAINSNSTNTSNNNALHLEVNKTLSVMIPAMLTILVVGITSQQALNCLGKTEKYCDINSLSQTPIFFSDQYKDKYFNKDKTQVQNYNWNIINKIISYYKDAYAEQYQVIPGDIIASSEKAFKEIVTQYEENQKSNNTQSAVDQIRKVYKVMQLSAGNEGQVHVENIFNDLLKKQTGILDNALRENQNEQNKNQKGQRLSSIGSYTSGESGYHTVKM